MFVKIEFSNGTYIATHTCWMMPCPFVFLQYHRNNHIASCCNNRNEHFQYCPTLHSIRRNVSLTKLHLTFNLLGYTIDVKGTSLESQKTEGISKNEFT